MSVAPVKAPIGPDILRSKIGLLTFLAPPGGLDTEDSCAALRASFERCREERALKVVVDLANVSLITSAALECLLEFHEAFSRLGGGLRLTNPSTTLREVFTITGISSRMPMDEGPGAADANPSARLVERGRLGDVLVARASSMMPPSRG